MEQESASIKTFLTKHPNSDKTNKFHAQLARTMNFRPPPPKDYHHFRPLYNLNLKRDFKYKSFLFLT